MAMVYRSRDGTERAVSGIPTKKGRRLKAGDVGRMQGRRVVTKALHEASDFMLGDGSEERRGLRYQDRRLSQVAGFRELRRACRHAL